MNSELSVVIIESIFFRATAALVVVSDAFIIGSLCDERLESR